jgi:hypothetical protein
MRKTWRLSFFVGLRYNAQVIEPGAQTERQLDARPVRSLLGRKPHRPRF